MSEKAPTIWMNVTTSANWCRPPVGIVRVERSLSHELSKLYGARFKKCIWQEGAFVEFVTQPTSTLGAETALKNVDLTEDVKSDQPLIFPLLSRKMALRGMAQSILSLMPGFLRPSFNRLLYYIRPFIKSFIANKAVKVWVNKLMTLKKRAPFQSGTEISRMSIEYKEGVVFAPGDIFISLGLDWDYEYYKQFYYLRINHGVKVVTCCYDLIPVLYPQFCVNDVASLFASYFLEIADGSDLVLCISKQTEKDLNELLMSTGGARPLTQVFPLGDNVLESSGESGSSEIEKICQAPFILFVSTIERRKNHEVLYRAYHALSEEGKLSRMPKLVFVGMQGWGVGDLMKDIDLDPLTENMIVRLNHISDSDLNRLYRAAEFCVFPSLYEGWGLPVGEALSMGKVVIASNRGSIPEVGIDSVIYLDPWDVRVWASEMYRMATDKSWREFWEQKVKEGYQPKEWSTAAEVVQSAIRTLENKTFTSQ